MLTGIAGTELRALEDTKTGALVVQRADDPNAARAAQTSSGRPTGKTEDGKLVLDKFGMRKQLPELVCSSLSTTNAHSWTTDGNRIF